MNHLIEINSLTKKYKKNCVLDAISFYIEPNKIYGLLGPNGAGKSTTIKVLVNQIPKTSGKIVYDSELKIMYLEDVPKFYEFYTIDEYLKFIYSVENSGKGNEEIEHILSKVGLLKHRKERINGISRGLRQRLGIAASILNKPDVLILDEPVSALDPMGRVEIFQLLNELKKKMSIIFSTHILTDVERICDHVILLDRGKIILNKPVTEIVLNKQFIIIEFLDKNGINKFKAHYVLKYNHIDVTKVKIESTDIIEAQNEVLKLIVKHNIKIKSINIKNETLEDVFISKVGNYE